MNKKYSIILSIALLTVLILTGCKTAESNPAANLPDNAGAAADGEYPEEMTVFETEDGVLSMIYPESWAIDQVNVEDGIAFGIVPRAEQFEVDANTLFEEPVVMVYGFTQQVGPDFASNENLQAFHQLTFYEGSTGFEYTLVGEPVLTGSGEDVTTFISQAESTLSSGVHTNWMLATAMADQTVIVYAVGLPDSAMDMYGKMAMDMFNSAQIDTGVTGQLAE